MLFDLDGVLTTTRAVHAAAWEQTFDEFLATWDAQRGSQNAPFDDRADYAAYVDGKPRQDGVRDFLASREITLPEGQRDSSPQEQSMWGLGNHSNCRRLVERTGLTDDEVTTWRRAAELIYVPYDKEAGVHSRPEISGPGAVGLHRHASRPLSAAAALPPHGDLQAGRRGARNGHAAGSLQLGRETPDLRLLRPAHDGDSSLSESIQAIAAADAGKYRSAEEHLVDAAAVDLADIAGNLRDSVHVASAGGAWMAVVHGFARYRWHPCKIEFAPILPTRARRLCVPLLLRGSLLEVDIEQKRVTYRLRSGNPMTAHHYGQEFRISVGSPTSFAGDYRTNNRLAQPPDGQTDPGPIRVDAGSPT